jgi:hypothetical protein
LALKNGANVSDKTIQTF